MKTRGKGEVSLERALSKLGLASRSQTREWILSGRLKVNGMISRNPLQPVNPDKSKFELDGKPLRKTRRIVILLHKPKGVVTTNSDEHGRPTVFSLLKDVPENLHAVGRLDQATTGLLLLTNDTKLSAFLTDPENEVPRRYIVTVRGRVLPERLPTLEKGKIVLRKSSGRESHLFVELREGKNRQVRNIFEDLGHEVTTLKRVEFGGVALGTLVPGQYRMMSDSEIEKLGVSEK